MARDVADLHGKEKRMVNENINMNKDKFKEGVHILDIKGTSFAIDLCDSEILTQNQVNASKHIHLLSERGYMKLASKIFDDEKSREIYDKLEDNYFKMKAKLVNY